MRIAQEKRLELTNCNGLLGRACEELDALMGRGASASLGSLNLDGLGPLAMRVVELRKRRNRLEAELRAITSEWDA
jgi:hypothetical protein